jgi:hypothetical protein
VTGRAGSRCRIAASLSAEADAEQHTGITSEQWMESRDSSLMTVAASDAYPLLSTVPPGSMDLDTLFEFGLRRMLDGVAVLLHDPGRRAVRRNATESG